MLLIIDRFNISQKYILVLVQRITKRKASYFTLPASYYLVPQTSMPLSAAKFMTSLPVQSIPKEAEITMKELAEHYRPQRTVRSETTKDKSGYLPPAAYVREGKNWNVGLSFPDSCAKSSTASVSNESVPLSTSSACTVASFVSDKSSSAPSLNLSRWMNLKVTRTVTMLKHNQRRL